MNDVSRIDPAATPTFAGRMIGRIIPALIALIFVVGLVVLGLRTGWRLPKFSALIGKEQKEKDDWCDEHSVPESICVECKKDCMPRAPEFGWCKKHGVHECPFCHPEVAQLPGTPQVSPADLHRAERALAFPRVENASKCKLQQRLIQIASDEALAKIRLTVEPVGRSSVSEFIAVNGEVGFDQTKTARLSSRVPGVIVHVEKNVGQWVQAGEILALVDSADVGKAKAEFLQALAQVDLKRKTMARLQASPEKVSGRSLSDAETALEEARIRLLHAEMTLANLGLPVDAGQLKDLPAAELANRLRFLGLPERVVKSLDAKTTSANLIAITAPHAGHIVTHNAVPGNVVESGKELFVLADTTYMWLTLDLRLEDARRIAKGQTVHFRPDGGEETIGQVAWISTAVDEKTRTVKARVTLPNSDGRVRANTFGSGRVILREESQAIVVPTEAVHWEGDCHVVFVRDKNFDKPDAKKVFHVRKVLPGVRTGPNTEIIAGLLPGELVATSGSGIFRAELLKGNLGEG